MELRAQLYHLPYLVFRLDCLRRAVFALQLVSNVYNYKFKRPPEHSYLKLELSCKFSRKANKVVLLDRLAEPSSKSSNAVGFDEDDGSDDCDESNNEDGTDDDNESDDDEDEDSDNDNDDETDDDDEVDDDGATNNDVGVGGVTETSQISISARKRRARKRHENPTCFAG
ncbi:hypothetical protein HDV05_003138, partial [Chytridiales sp. JEL 0842]